MGIPGGQVEQTNQLASKQTAKGVNAHTWEQEETWSWSCQLVAGAGAGKVAVTALKLNYSAWRRVGVKFLMTGTVVPGILDIKLKNIIIYKVRKLD